MSCLTRLDYQTAVVGPGVPDDQGSHEGLIMLAVCTLCDNLIICVTFF